MIAFLLPALLMTFPVAPEMPVFREINGIEILGGEGDTLQLLATVTLENRLSVEPVLLGLTYDILLEDTLSGSGLWSGQQAIPSEQVFQLQLPISIPERMIPRWISVLSGRDSISLGIDGRMDIEVMGIPWSQGWSMDQSVMMEGLLDQLLVREALRLQPRISDLSWPDPGLFSSSLDLELSFTNPYSFPITLTGINLWVEANRTEIGHLSSSASCLLPANSSWKQTYTMTVHHLSPIMSMIRSVSDGRFDYALEGTIEMIVDEVYISLPIYEQNSLSLNIFQ